MHKKKKFTLMIAASSFSVAILHSLNQIIFYTATRKEVLFSENGNFYNWRLGKIFYTKQGQGSPLLLIHDLTPASSDMEWKKTISFLKKNHTVYTLDLLGCGRSNKPKITYIGYLYVQLIMDFCKHIIQKPVNIVATGHSCQAVLMASSIDNSLFKNIILINPEKLSDTKKNPKHRHKILQSILNMPILGTFIYNSAVSRSILEKLFKDSYFGNHSFVPNKYIDIYYEAAHKGKSASKYLYSSIRCRYMNTPVSIAVAKINNPVVIFAGQKVPNIIKSIKHYQSLNSSVKAVLLKNCGYLPQLEYPEYFCKNLEIYLK